MSFHPSALDLNTLKRLSKSMKAQSAQVLEAPLTLAQSQELLSRAMGYPNWHAATHAPSHNSTSDIQDPFVSPSARLKMYLNLADLVSADISTIDGNIHFALRLYCEASNAYGDAHQAKVVEHLASKIKALNKTDALDALAQFASQYSRPEAMAIRMMGVISWRSAFIAAASQAEKACDIADYTKLSQDEDSARGYATKNHLSRRRRQETV